MNNEEKIKSAKRNVIAIGGLMWDKELVSGLNGNISTRIDEDTIVITAHKTCLGLLQEKGVLAMKLDGTLLEEGAVSSEKLLHTEIYKNFPDTQAIIHTHTTYTNAYFLENEKLIPKIFETRFYLGDVPAIPQTTPSVTDAGPIVEAFKKNNIVVLRNHGVVAMGNELFDCFLLIQALEDAIKTDAISRLYSVGATRRVARTKGKIGAQRAVPVQNNKKKYKLFSKEQIKNIVELVNKDKQMKELGEKTNMTMDLAVKLNETGKTYSFAFRKGKIEKVGSDENAEFLITASEKVWRAVFNREVDPFVATTQKKMHLRGDFAKISKWYAPCSRVFELWAEVPVE